MNDLQETIDALLAATKGVDHCVKRGLDCKALQNEQTRLIGTLLTVPPALLDPYRNTLLLCETVNASICQALIVQAGIVSKELKDLQGTKVTLSRVKVAYGAYMRPQSSFNALT